MLCVNSTFAWQVAFACTAQQNSQDYDLFNFILSLRVSRVSCISAWCILLMWLRIQYHPFPLLLRGILREFLKNMSKGHQCTFFQHIPNNIKIFDDSTRLFLFDMHQVSLHSSEQRELLESMDLAGVLERGTQIASDFWQFGSADCFKRLQISLQVRSLVTLLKPQMAQQHQDSSGAHWFGEGASRRCVGQKLITFAMACNGLVASYWKDLAEQHFSAQQCRAKERGLPRRRSGRMSVLLCAANPGKPS